MNTLFVGEAAGLVCVNQLPYLQGLIRTKHMTLILSPSSAEKQGPEAAKLEDKSNFSTAHVTTYVDTNANTYFYTHVCVHVYTQVWKSVLRLSQLLPHLALLMFAKRDSNPEQPILVLRVGDRARRIYIKFLESVLKCALNCGFQLLNACGESHMCAHVGIDMLSTSSVLTGVLICVWRLV